jgi:rod shape-determining protein MreC
VVVLVVISVSIITLGQRVTSVTSGLKSVASTVFSPFTSALNGVLRPIGNAFAGAFHYGALQDQNQKLQAELNALHLKQVQQSFENRQLQQITALQHLPFVGNLPTVTAQTSAMNVSNFAATIQIDKGRNDGVAVGMPVVGAGGLVGQVVIANHGSSTVRLVTDGQSTVGVVFGTPSVLGVANGQGAGSPLRANDVPTGSDVKVGQVMFTDGLQGAEYPPGIPVGTVASASSPPGALQMDITLHPSADMGQLAYVDVIQWETPP